MQIPGYFEDMNHLHVNTEPDRAYYIPASGRGCYFLDREQEAAVLSCWKNISSINRNFPEPGL